MTVEDYIAYIVMPIICLAIFFIMLRFIKGPQVVDRVVALDLLITVGVAFITLFSIIVNNPLFLDEAMILALIAFLSTVAFSFYIFKRKRDE
ncbi:multicomponent Na+:H+ antiporter subunit F [Paenimyroides aquimaris]|uniref:Multicomponent Na+:H+ antiporter subunit F n=1 Tax=Paenimyroides marinum TaxID=1159016 RepID=A0A1H6J4N3_9FLAO|nr:MULTISPECIES: monovalent cation/H+ antiporter complex subunit F [Flavobacteriaceae]WLD25058.1 monovalent cation/H+ antiporter complex subunit F [Flavobacterium dauae]SEH56615.1 multicomponent Na+:H+ antiporter subunit F [Paenimyroides aquimaris]